MLSSIFSTELDKSPERPSWAFLGQEIEQLLKESHAHRLTLTTIKTMIKMMVMMVIIIITILKAALSRYFSVSSLHYELSSMHTLIWPRCSHVQITCKPSGAYHPQHSNAMRCNRTAKLLILTRVEISFLFTFISLAETID